MYSKSNESDGIVKLSDPYHLSYILFLVGMVVFGLMSGSSMLGSIFDEEGFSVLSLFFFIISCIAAYIAFKHVAATKDGFVLDFNEGTFEFAATRQTNNIFEALNPANFWSGAKRTIVGFDDISRLSERDELKFKGGKAFYTYYIGIHGRFGSYEFAFTNINKRDELASYLVQASELGEPVVIR